MLRWYNVIDMTKKNVRMSMLSEYILIKLNTSRCDVGRSFVTIDICDQDIVNIIISRSLNFYTLQKAICSHLKKKIIFSYHFS